MRILVIGGTGLLGSAIVQALTPRHDVVTAARGEAREQVDITDPASIRALLARVARAAPLDAVVVAAGNAAWKPLAELSDDDFATSLGYKLMGQVNVARAAFAGDVLRDGGSVTLTSGLLADHPMPGSAAVSLVNAAVEAFARAAALEAPRDVRINVVSPGWVSETLQAMGRDPAHGTPASEVARAYGAPWKAA